MSRFKQKEKKTTLSQAKSTCCIFNPVQTRIGRYDMTQLLSNFWINSSNNTCSGGDNAKDRKSVLRKSSSKGSQLLHEFRRGCHAIEVDAWDKEKSLQREPVACQILDAHMLRRISIAQRLPNTSA